MNSNKACKNVRVDLSRTEEDWRQVRECFVKSFHRYPLYKYMVPDESKREAFLRAYLDANYEVTVGSGQGILVVIKASVDDVVSDEDANEMTSFKVVGGVVFVPPSGDGSGWAIGNDEPYWEAYDRHGLENISKEGLERVKRYEAWENKRVSQKASATRLPLWNGLFCAISPEYSSKGVGTTGYKECIRIMAQHSMKQQKEMLMMKRNPFYESTTTDAEDTNETFLNKVRKLLTPKQVHYFSLLSHRFIPYGDMLQKLDQPSKASIKNSETSRSLNLPSLPQLPLLVAVSQSERAAHFHKSNGFQVVARIPYHDPVEDVTPFYSHVLVLDPFRTGRMNQFAAMLDIDEDFNATSSQLKRTLCCDNEIDT